MEKFLEKIEGIQKTIQTIVLIIGIVIVIVSSFNSIAANTKEIGKLDARVKNLEENELTNRDILLELRFNLKKQMGKEYITIIPERHDDK